MGKFSINNKFFTEIWGKIGKTEEIIKTKVSSPIYNTNENMDINTPWTQLLGMDITTQQKEQPYFNDEDLNAFVSQYATNITPETAERINNENGTRLFSNDIDEATGGDNKLFDTAGLLFDDAARTNAA